MVKKYFYDSSIRKGVLSSLIGSAFFIYFLEPIIKFLGNWFLTLGSFFSSTFIDGLYLEMAKGRIDYSFVILEIILLSLIMALVSTSFLVFFNKKIEKKELSRIKKTGKKPFNKRPFIASFLLIYGCIMIFLLVMSNIKVNTIVNFEQRMKILSPYVDVEIKNSLESKFASMKTEDDFNNLYVELDLIAKKNDIILPATDYSNLY